MAVHTKKLYYRRAGVTYSIDLYTTTSEVGSEYLGLRDGSTSVYAKIGDTSDSNASHLRVNKSSGTKAILTSAGPLQEGTTTLMFDIQSGNSSMQGASVIYQSIMGQYIAYMSGVNSVPKNIYYSYIGSDIASTPGTVSAVTALSTYYQNYCPRVYFDDNSGVYYAFQPKHTGSSQNLYLYTSTDPYSFTGGSQVNTTVQSSGGEYTPAVFRTTTEWVMYEPYLVYSGGYYGRIRKLTSPDGSTWTEQATVSDFNFANGFYYSAQIVKVSETNWKLFYSKYTTTAAKWGIFYRETTDSGSSWGSEVAVSDPTYTGTYTGSPLFFDILKEPNYPNNYFIIFAGDDGKIYRNERTSLP